MHPFIMQQANALTMLNQYNAGTVNKREHRNVI